MEDVDIIDRDTKIDKRVVKLESQIDTRKDLLNWVVTIITLGLTFILTIIYILMIFKVI
jgi:hypothetical protein